MHDSMLTHLQSSMSSYVWGKSATTWCNCNGDKSSNWRTNEVVEPKEGNTRNNNGRKLNCPMPRSTWINCDTSWCKQTRMREVGVIAHNSNGDIVGGINRRWCQNDRVDTLEPSTILEGVRLSVEKGWTLVEIESDSKVVIDQIKGGVSYWRLRALINNISTLANKIESVTWNTIPRAANECANRIAKQARIGVRLEDWVSRPHTLF